MDYDKEVIIVDKGGSEEETPLTGNGSVRKPSPSVSQENIKLEEMEGMTGPPPPPPAENLYPVINPGPTPVEVPPTTPSSIPIGFEGQGKPKGIDNPAYLMDSGKMDPAQDSDLPTAVGHSESDQSALLGDDAETGKVRQRAEEELKHDTLRSALMSQKQGGEETIDIENVHPAKKKDAAETLLFKDGIRKIDFVLAYKESNDVSKEEKRMVFKRNLLDEGIEMETEDKSESTDEKTYFIKIHVPWEVMLRYAEMMRMKMPIKENDIDPTDDSEKTCPNPFAVDEDIIKPEPNYFTAAFDRERMKQFVIKDKESFFTNAQRSRVAYEILARMRYDDTDRDKFGIKRLINNGSFAAAYPLHEGKYKTEHSVLTWGADNERVLLFEEWARPGRWYKYQPLDLIRKYFGEKIAIYFTWLGYYTMMLIPASICGLVVFIYGLATLSTDIPSNEICDRSGPGNITMCPLCDKNCSYWRLYSSCRYSMVTYWFDNYGTMVFAVFMAVWATMFLEGWKRKQAEIEYEWDVAHFEEEEETVRPEFEATVRHKKKNPVTQTDEPFLPAWSKCFRYVTAFSVILFMLCLVLAAVFGVIIYRIVIVTLFYSTPDQLVAENARLATTATAAVINLVVIMILNRLYQFVALGLTNMELQRTQTEWEDSFTFKMFLFQCVNFYATLFYIAFFKGRFVGRPGDYDYHLLGFRQEECDPAGCLIELCIQLMIIMVGKQAFNNTKEIIIPKIMNFCRARNSKKIEETNLYTRWEQDFDLGTMPPLGLFDEYLEMVLQYGFVTLFVAAFPLAPLFALINNVIEIRLDAYKFVTQWRRPLADRAQDIGIWWGILNTLSMLSVLTNAFIIGFTSEFVPKQLYLFTQSTTGDLTGYTNFSLSSFDVKDFQNKSIPNDPKIDVFGNVTSCMYRDFREDHAPYNPTLTYWHVLAARLAFVLVFEHVVFLLRFIVAFIIPDVPGFIKIQMLRENYLAKEALYTAELEKSKNEREKQD